MGVGLYNDKKPCELVLMAFVNLLVTSCCSGSMVRAGLVLKEFRFGCKGLARVDPCYGMVVQASESCMNLRGISAIRIACVDTPSNPYRTLI